jgi:hypothetical protein
LSNSASRRLRHDRALTLPLAVLVLVLSASPAHADQVTPWDHKEWSDGENVTYAFDGNVPPWLAGIMRDVLEDKWADLGTNNSDGPDFIEDANYDFDIRFQASAPTFCGTLWLGCTTTNAPNRMWIRAIL